MADPRYVFQQVTYEAVTPIHIGSGQDVGIVDLPIIRERTSGHPYLPGSGIRGALRSRSQKFDVPTEEATLTQRLFGSDEPAEISAGCLSVLDAHLVLFPVRCVPGVFRYVTCPFVLQRWQDLHEYFLGTPSESIVVPEDSPAEGTFEGAFDKDSIYLEEYPFRRHEGSTWTWTGALGVAEGDVLLLSDVDFHHFVVHATVVRQRNRLTSVKTVKDGHLFSVEALPARARFVGFVGATGERRITDSAESLLSANQALTKIRKHLVDRSPERSMETHIVLGGDESVGWGVTRLVWNDRSDS